jgi:hypothetical protein
MQQGLCSKSVRHGKVAPGKTVCQKCLDAKRLIRERHKAWGTCSNGAGHGPRLPHKTLCQSCSDDRSLKRREAQRARGGGGGGGRAPMATPSPLVCSAKGGDNDDDDDVFGDENVDPHADAARDMMGDAIGSFEDALFAHALF